MSRVVRIKTKYLNIKIFDTKGGRMKELANLFYELGMLGRLKRLGPLLVGIDNPESIAQQNYRAAVIAFILAKMEKANAEKTVMMCLLHDLARTRIGDQNKVSMRYIDVKEVQKEVIKEQLENLPKEIKEEFKSLLDEYNKRESKEAIVARDADLLEGITQAREYLEKGYKDMQIWIDRSHQVLKTKSAKKLAKDLLGISPNNWFKGLKVPPKH